MERFGKGFYLGASSAAHQIEGNNTNSDCWALENIEHSSYVEPSGIGCDSYNRYEEDIELLADAGLNEYRFSIEWARIEPEDGVFSEAEIEHYRDVIRCCRAHGVEPMVTLHHFSSPAWLISKGGWEADSVVDDFARYVRFVAEKLGNELNYVCTINEANMRVQIGNIMKRYMMQAQMAAKAAAAANASAEDAAEKAAKDAESGVQMGMNVQAMMARQQQIAIETAAAFGLPAGATAQVFQSPCTPHGDELVGQAHMAAREVLREVAPQVKVGITLSLHDTQAAPGGEARAAEEWDAEFTHYLPYLEGDDFIGVQNYTRSIVGANGWLPTPEGAELTAAGYEYYPEGLEHVIRAVAKDFHGDLFVTENGYDGEDPRRCDYIEAALTGVQCCIADGLPVIGYSHWSLLDNFEWQKGYGPKFGLVAVDRKTMERTPKPSLALLGSYAPEA